MDVTAAACNLLTAEGKIGAGVATGTYAGVEYCENAALGARGTDCVAVAAGFCVVVALPLTTGTATVACALTGTGVCGVDAFGTGCWTGFAAVALGDGSTLAGCAGAS